jgi:hypothetical protein
LSPKFENYFLAGEIVKGIKTKETKKYYKNKYIKKSNNTLQWTSGQRGFPKFNLAVQFPD